MKILVGGWGSRFSGVVKNNIKNIIDDILRKKKAEIENK